MPHPRRAFVFAARVGGALSNEKAEGTTIDGLTPAKSLEVEVCERRNKPEHLTLVLGVEATH